MTTTIGIIALLTAITSIVFCVCWIVWAPLMSAEWPLGLVTVVAAVSFIISIGAFAASDGIEQKRLMAACMKDFPEYECVSKLRRPDTTVMPVPIIIPMGR